MLTIEGGFVVRGAYCYPDPADASRLFYLPFSADCVRDAFGRPQASLLAAGDKAFLQLASVWDVPGVELERIRAEAAARLGLSEPSLLRLAYAPVTVEAVELLAADGGRDERALALGRSSGLAPHSAMFNLPLAGADRDRAMAAFSGRPGFLRVLYRGTLATPRTHRAELSGDLYGVTDEALLEAALSEGRAALAPEPEDVDLRRALLRRGLQALRLTPPDVGAVVALRIEVMIEAREEIAVSADVGTWFQGVVGVVPVPGPGFEPAPAPGPGDPLTVALDLPGAQEVLERVEAAAAGSSARLERPDFPPASLPRPEPASPVHVRATFVDGGADFEADRPAPVEGPLVLAAGDVGLTEVTFDAGALAERGLCKLRATLRYRPEGPGERGERTFHFREPPFNARWLVVSRGEPLGSSLTYEYRATLGSGESVAQGPVAASSPTITLAANPEE